VADETPQQPSGMSISGDRLAPAAVMLREARAADAEEICAIYNYEVANTTATFDLVPRSLAEQVGWIDARSGAFAAIVAVEHLTGAVLGFASLSPYKERAAYRTSVEDSVYVARSAHGQGIGRLLVNRVLDVAAAHGFHAVFARIEASGTASRKLHEACGFELVGVEREVGRKFGRWLDVAIMECVLRERR
jgi:L-amino acid N-acyltransferase